MQISGLGIPDFHITHISWLINGMHLAFVGVPMAGRTMVPIMGTIELETGLVTEYLPDVTGGIAASPLYEEVAVVTSQGICIVSFDTGYISEPIPISSMATDQTGDLVWSPDGKWLAVTGTDPTSRSPTNPTQNLLIINRFGQLHKTLQSASLMLHLAWSTDSQHLAFRHLPGMHVRFISIGEESLKIAEPFAQFFYPSPRPNTGAMVLQSDNRSSKLLFKHNDRTINVASYQHWEVEKPPQRVWWSLDGTLCLFRNTTKFQHPWQIFRVETLAGQRVQNIAVSGELTSPTWSITNDLAFVLDGQVIIIQREEQVQV